jgi:hypothetical protein
VKAFVCRPALITKRQARKHKFVLQLSKLSYLVNPITPDDPKNPDAFIPSDVSYTVYVRIKLHALVNISLVGR